MNMRSNYEVEHIMFADLGTYLVGISDHEFNSTKYGTESFNLTVFYLRTYFIWLNMVKPSVIVLVIVNV